MSSNLENAVKILMVGVGGVAIALAAVWWMVRTALFLKRHRQWSWMLAVAPFTAAAAIFFAFVPGPVTFNDQRAAFDRVARETIADPTRHISATKIGPFDVTAIRREDGGVYLYDSDEWAGKYSGWIYSPGKQPTYYNFYSLKDLGGGWYEFRAGT